MFRPGGFSALPVVVRNMLIINVIMFLATQFLIPGLFDKVTLHHPLSDDFRIYQVVTHIFVHLNTAHLLFNMLGLWMFGTEIERYWGPRKFLNFYMLCGLGSAALYMGVEYYRAISATDLAHMTHIIEGKAAGASGSLSGILVAFGFMFPNNIIMSLFPPIPMKAKYYVIFFGLVSLFAGLSGPRGGVAHFGHLGGLIMGLIIILYWRHRGRLYN
jgi:membrane associated rhomboid family serine protease